MDQCGTSTGTPLCICVSVSTRACVCVSRQCVMPQWIHPLTHPLARCTYASYACTAIWMENENDRPRRSDIGLDLLFSRIFFFCWPVASSGANRTTATVRVWVVFQLIRRVARVSCRIAGSSLHDCMPPTPRRTGKAQILRQNAKHTGESYTHRQRHCIMNACLHSYNNGCLLFVDECRAHSLLYMLHWTVYGPAGCTNATEKAVPNREERN